DDFFECVRAALGRLRLGCRNVTQEYRATRAEASQRGANGLIEHVVSPIVLSMNHESRRLDIVLGQGRRLRGGTHADRQGNHAAGQPWGPAAEEVSSFCETSRGLWQALWGCLSHSIWRPGVCPAPRAHAFPERVPC